MDDNSDSNSAVQIFIDNSLLKRKRSFNKSDTSLNIIKLTNQNSIKNIETDDYIPKDLNPIFKEKILKIINPNIVYEQLKYNGIIYNLGDFITVTDMEDFSVCKITKIIPYNLSNTEAPSYWPSIRVQWYYRKKDINREKNNILSNKKFGSISDFEVFKTEHSDIIFIESLINKCYVYTYDEYEELENHSDFTFFSRASYDPNKKMLNPSFDKWEKACKCMLPLNPDQLYIKCDKCGKWYHPSCCGLSETNLDNIDFICYKC